MELARLQAYLVYSDVVHAVTTLFGARFLWRYEAYLEALYQAYGADRKIAVRHVSLLDTVLPPRYRCTWTRTPVRSCHVHLYCRLFADEGAPLCIYCSQDPMTRAHEIIRHVTVETVRYWYLHQLCLPESATAII